jgi:hypothetical protein
MILAHAHTTAPAQQLERPLYQPLPTLVAKLSPALVRVYRARVVSLEDPAVEMV